MGSRRCASPTSETSAPQIRAVLDSPGPIVCEVMAPAAEERAPRLSTMQRPDGSMVSKPLEDLWPFLDRDEFLLEHDHPAAGRLMVIAIMQGRLVPPIDGRIQCFPRERWRDEFALAAAAGLDAIEWIYDVYGADVQPHRRRRRARSRCDVLSTQNGVMVRSLCADYFMEQAARPRASDRRDRGALAAHRLAARSDARCSGSAASSSRSWTHSRIDSDDGARRRRRRSRARLVPVIERDRRRAPPRDVALARPISPSCSRGCRIR